MKQFAPAFERNRDPITEVLGKVLPNSGLALEIGSGAGQHVSWFAKNWPGLTWQPSEMAHLDSIDAWAGESGCANISPAIRLDLNAPEYDGPAPNAILCINVVHIVSWPLVQNLFAFAGRILAPSGRLFVYGPYRYAGQPLEPSNQQFEQWLKSRDPQSAIRSFEAVNELAAQAGLKLIADVAMPANNRSIWWQKQD